MNHNEHVYEMKSTNFAPMEMSILRKPQNFMLTKINDFKIPLECKNVRNMFIHEP